jgi:DNA-binding transcriptional LysR family regulator
MKSAINLRSIDLNLLVFFDALMSERHVTRAANKVAISQSAMSNALSRLRHVFKDELFIRTSKGMEPTTRAIELGQSIGQILQQTSRLMFSDTNFDPLKSSRSYLIRMSDLIGSLVLRNLINNLEHAAPNISLDILHISPEKTVDLLESDQLDIALSTDLKHNSSIKSKKLISDRMVCILNKNHPLARDKLTLKRFLDCQHLRVSMSPTDIRFVDNVLANKGYSRKVTLNVPHWLLVPNILKKTNLIGVISERLASSFTDDDLILRPLPFKANNFYWTMYWHRRYEHNQSHQWLRDQITAISSTYK